MQEFEDRKNLRRDNLKQKKCKSSRSESDGRELKRKTKEQRNVDKQTKLK